MPIRLDSINNIPSDILGEHRRRHKIFLNTTFAEQLVGCAEFRQLVFELNRLCNEQGIVGYHYTRANPHEIQLGGLAAIRGWDHRNAFLKTYGNIFTVGQINRIKSQWTFFDNYQTQIRDRRIWFNFTLTALSNGGAGNLLRYFGGEQISMPLTNDEEIATILQSIGESLVVEVALDPGRLFSFPSNPWGNILLSSYHRSVICMAEQFDVDAFLSESVPSSQILKIRSLAR